MKDIDKDEAEEYVDTLLNKDDAELDKFLDEYLGDLKLNKKQAGAILGIIKGVGICSYLAGLKAGKDTNVSTKWHDLRKDPNDLPKCNTDCIVVKEYEGTNGKYTRRKLSMYSSNKFLIWNHERDCYVTLHNIIAWCEIPQFKE